MQWYGSKGELRGYPPKRLRSEEGRGVTRGWVLFKERLCAKKMYN